MLYHLLIEREKFCKCKNVIIMWVRYTFLKALIYVDRGRLDSSLQGCIQNIILYSGHDLTTEQFQHD